MSPLALLLVLGAAIAHAGWNVLAHGVSKLGAPFLLWAALAATLIWLPVVPFTGGIGAADLSSFAIGVGVSGVLHIAYMLVLQGGYARADLSTVYATARGSGPVLSVIGAILLFAELPSGTALLGIAIVILGVVAVGFIGRRPDAKGLGTGVVWGVLTGVGIATYTIWDSFSVREWGIQPVAMMVGTTAVEVVLYLAISWRRRASFAPILRDHWPRILAFGALSPLSYILVLTAVQIAPVSLVAPMREVSVVLVSLWGGFVLAEGRPWARVAAAVVVAAGVVLVALGG
jgi:drug/metabolite transporter (DMT)-like permease